MEDLQLADASESETEAEEKDDNGLQQPLDNINTATSDGLRAADQYQHRSRASVRQDLCETAGRMFMSL